MTFPFGYFVKVQAGSRQQFIVVNVPNASVAPVGDVGDKLPEAHFGIALAKTFERHQQVSICGH